MHDLPPVVESLLIIVVAIGPVLGLQWWVTRRDRGLWTQAQAERERQWALQEQLRETEQQIREE